LSSTSKTVLVFDDDAIYGKIIQRQASSMNVKAEICTTLDDFCVKALEGQYDVALIDFHLDDYKGDDVARVVENRPVILMSMDIKASRVDYGTSNGIVAFVSKQKSAREVICEALKFVA
jgi:DNA-binding response OmpR family regulator